MTKKVIRNFEGLASNFWAEGGKRISQISMGGRGQDTMPPGAGTPSYATDFK